jgi:alpha-L-fucosidase 2
MAYYQINRRSMFTQSRREFIAAIPVALSAANYQSPTNSGESEPAQKMKLWYKQPARVWTEALPVGNGRLGAMVFGGVDSERLQLNEDTLWSGAPKDWNDPHASEYLPEVRRLVMVEQKYHEADQLCKKMQGPYNDSYVPVGNLDLKFAGTADGITDAQDYRRELDLDSAVAGVSYAARGVKFTREVFSSAVDQVITVRLTSDKPGQISFRTSLNSPVRSSSKIVESGLLRLSGKAPSHVDPNYKPSENPVIYDDAEGHGMHFECWLRVISEGGTVEPDGDGLQVSEASAVTLLIAAGTGYAGYDRPPDLKLDAISAKCRATLEAAVAKPYTSLRSSHVQDHQKLFRRLSLDLGTSPASALPTDERLEAFKKIRMISN